MNENPLDAEILPPTDNAALQAIVSAEIDVSIATAHRYPRSIDKAKKRLYDKP